ncbi:MAG: hypothetical protein JRJ45_07980 [Deltaproteobacteria bacterium]|nr:hypothetical protein [Deltaproteobacteria bacterium]
MGSIVASTLRGVIGFIVAGMHRGVMGSIVASALYISLSRTLRYIQMPYFSI